MMNRQGGGNAWPGLIFSALLMLSGLVLLISAEMVFRDGVRDINAIGGRIVDLKPGAPVDGLEGRLVRIHGVPSMDRPAQDVQFGISVDTPQLERKVEMQQWRELKSPDGDVTYVRNWFDHPIISSHFEQARRHQNPGFPFVNKQFEGKGVRLGGLLLSRDLLQSIPGHEQVAPDFSTLPSGLTASFRLADNALWSSINPQSPLLGDLRVSWIKRPLRELTVLARVNNGSLQAAPHLSVPGYVVMIGNVPLDALMPGLPKLPRFTWLWRTLGLLLAGTGVWLYFSSRSGQPADPLLTLGLGIAPLALISAVVWLGTRWSVLLAWLLLSVLAGACVAWRWRVGHPASES